MQAKWIVENFSDSEDYRALIKAVRDSGRYCFVIGPRDANDFNPKGFEPNDCVIVQGSIQMTKNIASRLPQGCYPIAYSSWEKYLCTAYYPHFATMLFNDTHMVCGVGQLKDDRFGAYRMYGKEALIFVRPDSGEKTFQAQLLDLQDFDKFWSNATSGGGNCSDMDTVIVSTPKTINGEYRFVCSRREIIAYSTYQYQGQRTLIPYVPLGATAKVKEILKVGYYPDPVFCVDIAEDADGHFWLLELTSFSSAGLYAADKDKIAKRVSEIVEKDYLDKKRNT